MKYVNDPQAGISKDKVIPLYGRGNADGKDPR